VMNPRLPFQMQYSGIRSNDKYGADRLIFFQVDKFIIRSS
jgi:hypothetical protein